MSATPSNRTLLWIALGIPTVLVVVPALTMGVGVMGVGPMMGGGWDHGMWGGAEAVPTWLLVVGVGMQLLFLAVLFGLGYLVYRALTQRSGSTDPALEALRTEYARGEMSDEEFERRRERLESDS